MPLSTPRGVPAVIPGQLSLAPEAASKLATTTKTVPQMQGVTPRWLLRMLPWEEVGSGTYRVNRRLVNSAGDGLITFTGTGDRIRVIPGGLRELPPLRDFADSGVLGELAGRLERRDYGPGDVIVAAGQQADRVYLIAHGKVARIGAGRYGNELVTGVLASGQYFGDQVLSALSAGAPSAGALSGGALPAAAPPASWEFTARAVTTCTVFTLSRQRSAEVAARTGLGAHLEAYRARRSRPRNSKGEAAIAVAVGHAGEPGLPGTFADYDGSPREYPLGIAQTVLRVHTRVADLYNDPMSQVEEQIRLTVEALRERQERELINNPEFGLLANADPGQRINTRSGPPAPADMDALLCRRRKTRFFLAHPRAIAAFGRECSNSGIYPDTTLIDGRPVTAWRGVPVLPCDKIPLTAHGVTSILALRTGLADEGVIGLHQTGLDGEREPGLAVRLRGTSDKGIMSYLISAYYSAAILVPDALGVLANVETAS